MPRVKCAICGEYFDREKEPCVKHNARRYAHLKCEPDGEPYTPEQTSSEEQDKKELQDYIIKIQGLKSCGPRINKEIKTFHDTYNYSYSGMLKTLKWWYEIEKHPVDNRFIGSVQIIGSIYDTACKYYYSLFLAQQKNQEKNINDYVPKDYSMTIVTPKPKRKIKLFTMEE